MTKSQRKMLKWVTQRSWAWRECGLSFNAALTKAINEWKSIQHINESLK